MPTRLITAVVVALVSIMAATVGYRLVRSRIAVHVYRDRLESLSQEYEQLRGTYNQAVARTAVTELLVKDGALQVVVRTAEGRLKQIDTPFDPSREIYVDYVILDGRLWIRRVFDAQTPPERGVLVDPGIATVQWERLASGHGKAVYRSLSEGRWVVTVTGDGSLGLAKAEEGSPPALLSPPPEIRDFDQIDQDVRASVDRIGPGEVLRSLVDGKGG